MLSSLSRRERVMLIFLIFFALGAGYYFYIYQPLEENIANLSQLKINKELQINKTTATLRKLPVLQDRYDQLQYIEEELNKNKINSADEMLAVLEGEAGKSGIKISSFIPEEDEKETEISILLKGNYNQLIKFLEGIEKLNGQAEFSNMRIARIAENNLLEAFGIIIYHDDLLTGGDKP
ncbi:type II secretion system protein GspM [Halocella sp. SP3-1]|uniref:type 4a pilus biogenesis protein PilO n=1 Tax=Halocella sp. SP3-1 TaxID=2382161 RepID=UPI000F7F5A3D|nr:type II secretion system protein GspM [Halocella sp. SP3-1]